MGIIGAIALLKQTGVSSCRCVLSLSVCTCVSFSLCMCVYVRVCVVRHSVRPLQSELEEYAFTELLGKVRPFAHGNPVCVYVCLCE